MTFFCSNTLLLRGRLSRRPFSLLELIIVLALLSTVLAIVVPRIGYKPFYLQKAEARRNLKIAFHTAVSRATATNSHMTLTLNFKNHKVQIKQTPGNASVRRSTAIQSEGPVADHFAKYSDFDLPEILKLDPGHPVAGSGPPQYHFFPNGEAEGPLLHLLIDDIPLQVSVEPLNGRPILVEPK